MKDLVMRDVAIAHVEGKSVLPQQRAGYAADERVKAKQQHTADPGTRFVPKVMETYGRMCPHRP